MVRSSFALRFLGILALFALGCQPSIGDKCQLSTDCSSRGDRLCDTSQPDGYCTVFNCFGNSCPNDGVCVLFAPSVPGCAYDDRRPSRLGRSMCLATCEEDSDCRAGYVCRAPGDPTYGAKILSTDQTRKACLVAPIAPSIVAGDAGSDAAISSPSYPVCSADGPDIPPIDAGTKSSADAAADAGTDGAADGAADAGTD